MGSHGTVKCGKLGKAWKHSGTLKGRRGTLEFSLGILNCGCGEGNSDGRVWFCSPAKSSVEQLVAVRGLRAGCVLGSAGE